MIFMSGQTPRFRSYSVHRQSRFGGRGLFTTRAVAAARHYWLSPRALFRCPRSCAPSGEHWATRLALRLEQLSTSQSPPPYVWALPTAAPNVLHNWDAVALAELQNETLANEAMLWRETRREQFDLVKDRIRDEQRFNYLYDLVQSRIIGARGDRRYAEQGGTLRLVPLIDIAQHSPYGGQFAFRNGRMVLQAAKAMAKGSECFMDYGARTNDEFALQYGFVPDRNPHDQLTITCGAKGRTRNVRWDQTRCRPELREACASLLSRMPTTLGEDVQMLREDSGESTEQSIALNYRIAKKQVRRCKCNIECGSRPRHDHVQPLSAASLVSALAFSLAALIYLFFFSPTVPCTITLPSFLHTAVARDRWSSCYECCHFRFRRLS